MPGPPHGGFKIILLIGPPEVSGLIKTGIFNHGHPVAIKFGIGKDHIPE